MVLAHYGRHVATRELRSSLRPGRDGVTALALVECARRHGLAAEGLEVNVDTLAALPVPAILHTTSAHFVVLEEVRAEHALIVDPLAGDLRLDRASTSAILSGIALAFDPLPSFQRRSHQALLRDSLGPAFAVGRQTAIIFVSLVACVAAVALGAGSTAARYVVALGGGRLDVLLPPAPVLAEGTLLGIGGWMTIHVAHITAASHVSERLATRLTARLAGGDGPEPGAANEVLLGRFQDCDPITSHAFPDCSRPALFAGVVLAVIAASFRPATDVAMLAVGIAVASLAAPIAAKLLAAGETRRRVTLHKAGNALRVILERMWMLRAPWEAASGVPRWSESHAAARRVVWHDTVRRFIVRAAHATFSVLTALALLLPRWRVSAT